MTMIPSLRFCVVGYICTRSISYDKINVKREARMLDRMMKQTVSKKKTLDKMPGKLKQDVLVSAYDNEGSNRKTASLNKHYMWQIVDLINSGPFGSQISEIGLEFTKVKITHCRSNISVFWILNKSDTSESVIAEVLRNLKRDLQSQMGFLMHMRKTPYITFVKDLRLERQNIVEKLLEVADFGKDYQPTSARKVVSPEPNELQNGENAENLKMRQNVLGLDHAKIKEKLMQNVKRFEQINIKKNELEEITQFEHPQKLAVFNKKLFDRFYKKKLYLDQKLKTREYDGSFIELNEPYDPEEEANKHWEFLKFKDDFTDTEEKEMQDYTGEYDDAFREDDGCSDESYTDDEGWCNENGSDDDRDDGDNDELEKIENSMKKHDKYQ